MTFDEMSRAVEEANSTIRKADMHVNKMAHICAGRLRAAGVGHTALCALKRELADYNMHTGEWKK